TGLTDPEQVMCCTGSYHARLKAAAWYSADGRSWSRAIVKSPAQETIFFPFAGSGGLAAGGFNSTWLSADGRSWRPGPRGSDVGPVASDGERIIGASQGDGEDVLDLWVSTDGESWQALADAGDTTSKPSWNGSVNGSVNDYVLLPTGLAMIGFDGERTSGTLLWLAQPTGAR